MRVVQVEDHSSLLFVTADESGQVAGEQIDVSDDDSEGSTSFP